MIPLRCVVADDVYLIRVRGWCWRLSFAFGAAACRTVWALVSYAFPLQNTFERVEIPEVALATVEGCIPGFASLLVGMEACWRGGWLSGVELPESCQLWLFSMLHEPKSGALPELILATDGSRCLGGLKFGDCTKL